MLGRFDNNSLVIDIEVISPLLNGQLRQTLPVGIDTGFTNDLCLTYNIALPLGLTLVGFQDYNLGDGTKVTFLECFGYVKLGTQQTLSTISVRPSGSLLIGVSLLKKLGCTLKTDFVNETVEITQVAPVPTATPAAVPTQTPTPPAVASTPAKIASRK